MGDRSIAVGESNGSASASGTPGPPIPRLVNHAREDLGTNGKPEKRAATIRENHAIARAELVRRKRRLGDLTLDQEQAVEKLLVLTVDRVSELSLTFLDLLETAA